MEPHLEEGTQRLELPVSRTTLNSCGGVPIVMSEKSRICQHPAAHGTLRDESPYTGRS